MTELLSKNSKMSKSGLGSAIVYNFGIPAYESKATGIRTCPMAGTCAKGCYANQGSYVWSNVAQAYEWRLQQTLRVEFVEDMIEAIAVKQRTAKRNGKQLYIRIHDSGDFYNLEYIAKWFLIMNALPEVKFYAYTKMVRMFKGIQLGGRWTIPANFTLIFSFGGLQDSWIDIHTDRHSAIFESESALNEAGYSNAMDDDLIATGANHRIGLVYHGAKIKQFTAKGA